MNKILNKSTFDNLKRKSMFTERVQFFRDVVLFSWVDLNLTELCNRSCVFCPRVDQEAYPNQALHMSTLLADRIASELKFMNFMGVVVLCGFGEPLLHPKVPTIAEAFGRRGIRVELVTNGDHLTVGLAKRLYRSGIKFFNVSMYDGPEQIVKFDDLFSNADIEQSNYLLRDRWHGPDQDFGLKLTNRAGLIDVGNQEGVDLTHPCFYPSYSLVVDWNGDVLLCVQDWHKKVKMGNVYGQTIFDIWSGSKMMKARERLAFGSRCDSPCNKCNAEGTLHGGNHVKSWGFVK